MCSWVMMVGFVMVMMVELSMIMKKLIIIVYSVGQGFWKQLFLVVWCIVVVIYVFCLVCQWWYWVMGVMVCIRVICIVINVYVVLFCFEW